jgi:hypothetical protein
VLRRAAGFVGVLVGASALAACGSGRPARLDQGAVAVAGRYTQLAFNEHDCRAASRYSSAPLCQAGMPFGSDYFPLTSHRITRDCAGFSSSPSGSHASPGCIVYTAANGDTVLYFMNRTREGWRIVQIGTLRGT